MGLLNLFKKKPAPLELEIQRIQKARSFMNNWNDIPLTMLYPGLNDILDIPGSTDATHLFSCILLRTHSDVELATSLLNYKNGLNRTA